MELKNAASYISEIKQILARARQKAYSAVNSAMVEAYWLVGKRIVDEEQKGEDRAAYGKEILKTLSASLSQEFGKGFSITNLQNFRKFYLVFSDLAIEQTVSVNFDPYTQQTVSVKTDTNTEIGQATSVQSENGSWQTAFAKLTWSHLERLIRVENVAARNFYIIEAAQQHWGVRELDRNISTLYYQRLVSSQIPNSPFTSKIPEPQHCPTFGEIIEVGFDKLEKPLKWLEISFTTIAHGLNRGLWTAKQSFN